MTEEPLELQRPQVLSPCSSGRRRTGDSSSPEFEFWMVRNPSFPQPNLLSADELFSDGVLLPLHLLQPNSSSSDDPNPTTPAVESEPGTEREPSGSDRNGSEPGSTPGPSSVLQVLSAPAAPTISSKRWKDIIFKKTERRNSGDDNSHTVKEKDKERRKEKKGTGVGVGGGGNNPLSAAELNINIWPFSRSRSAGNGGSRPRMAAAGGATRKVSSAPCSRSNSSGESKSRKWPSSPSRGGVHLGRSSPVWQVRRAGGLTGKGVDVAVKNAEKPVKKEVNECRRKTTSAVSSGSGAKPKVLQLNVPMCIGYRHHLSCRSDENSAVSVAAAAEAAGSSGDGSGIQRGGNNSDEGIRGSSNLFNFRNLFTKKVH